MSASHIEHMREFTRFYTNVIGLLDQHILNSEFSLPEARVLFELNQHGKCMASEIMNTLRMDRGYLSRLLLQFEKQGLINRKKSKADGRASYLSLTPKGQKAFSNLNDSSQKQVMKILEPLSLIQQKKLILCMEEIRKILSSKQ